MTVVFRINPAYTKVGMTDLVDTKHPSSSVGDYLKAIWELSGDSSGTASTKEVSGRLGVSPASVTNMFVRLRKMGLAGYERYHGASLTEEGRAQALRLVRRHRLIEAFLLEHLDYSWEEVHDEAERLEHAVSDGFTERLAELLEDPERDPHGDPIPATDGTLAREDSWPLSDFEAGQRLCISRINHGDASMLTYLRRLALVPGRSLAIREVRAVDGVVIVEDEHGNHRSLGGPLADSIFARKAPEERP